MPVLDFCNSTGSCIYHREVLYRTALGRGVLCQNLSLCLVQHTQGLGLASSFEATASFSLPAATSPFNTMNSLANALLAGPVPVLVISSKSRESGESGNRVSRADEQIRTDAPGSLDLARSQPKCQSKPSALLHFAPSLGSSAL
jgi:hypothetical protein